MSKSAIFSFFTFRKWSMRMATTLVGLLFACGGVGSDGSEPLKLNENGVVQRNLESGTCESIPSAPITEACTGGRFGTRTFTTETASCSTLNGQIITDDVSACSDTSTVQMSEVSNADYESRRLGNTPTPDFRVTGLYAPARTQLKLQVNGTPAPNSTLNLLVGTYSRYNNAGRDPTFFSLKPGANTLTVGDYGGIVYIQYTVNSKPVSKQALSFVFGQGFVTTPRYVLGKTNAADWKKQLSIFTDTPDVVMESKRAFMVFSRDNALAWKENDQDLVLRTADQILDAEDAISGLDGSSEAHRRNTNQFLMTQAEDGWMYATNFRTAYSSEAAKFAFTPLITGKLPNAGDAWGIWHELGHLHQQPWTWEELGEVTVNIYSLAAERSLQVSPGRLANDNDKRNAMAYLAKPESAKNFNASSVDEWIRLYMFHQLWLAFGDGFYQQLHRQTRDDAPELNDDAEKMRYFMLKACTISGKDLSGFF
jgi:hypothetical protein